nr:MAG TPA: hypothetical protein [Caudoviricetes sp.]
MNIITQIKYDCYSRARWVREQTAQGIPLDELELQSARNLANNAFKWDYDSASQELYDAVAENQKLII